MNHGEKLEKNCFMVLLVSPHAYRSYSWFPASSKSIRYAKACGGVPAVGTFLVAVALSEASDPITVTTVTFFVRGD